jgi:hypothetical protein
LEPKPVADISYLVLTNSNTDYQVLVKSPDVSESATRAVDALARRCGPRVEDDVVEFAGVTPEPGRLDGFWAVRGLRCKLHAGRRTLGFIAVWIPAVAPDGPVAWQYLAAQKPPLPDQATYDLSPPDPSAQPCTTPLEHMRLWEEQRGHSIPPQLLVFDKRISTMLNAERRRSGRRTLLKWIIPAVVLLIGATAIALRFLRSPVPVPVAQTPLLTPTQREQILLALNSPLSTSTVDPQLSADQLVARALQAGPLCRVQLTNLRTELEKRIDINASAGEMQTFFREQQHLLESPQVIGPDIDASRAAPPQSFHDVMPLLQQYNQTRSLMSAIVEDDPATSAFKDHFQELRSKLDEIH